MVIKSMIKVLCIVVVVMLLLSTNVFAKSYHFKAFASEDALNDAGLWGPDTVNFMVQAMQKLEYNNYYGTNSYHVTSSKQDVLNYIGMSGNNYGFVVSAHGNNGYFTMGDSNERITTNDISGNWHLVLINSCFTYFDNSMARAFKTVGYDNRASIGFYGNVTYGVSYNFWRIFNDYVGSTTLDSIVNMAADATSAPVVLWGDGFWNGYAWY